MRKQDLQILHEILESRGGFGHREHLELAWTYLRRYPTDEAAKVTVAAIQRIARQDPRPTRRLPPLPRTSDLLLVRQVGRPLWVLTFAGLLALKPG
jgi:hypothetical protein